MTFKAINGAAFAAGLFALSSGSSLATTTCLNNATLGCTGTVQFELGTPLPQENHILIDVQNDNVSTFFGTTQGQPSGTAGIPVRFDATPNVDTGSGFANVKADGVSSIQSLTITTPGYLFGNFQFDVQMQESNVPDTTTNNPNDNLPFPLTITAYKFDASTIGSWVIDPLTLAQQGVSEYKSSADMSFLLTSLLNSLEYSNISKVVISSVLNSTAGIFELKHFQISGTVRCPNGDCRNFNPPLVPLPAAFPLLASGLGALSVVAWRRKRKLAKVAE